MLNQAEPSFDEEAGTHKMGPPLTWWRQHLPQRIINRQDDLLAEISTATRGLIADTILNSALGANASMATLIAEQLSGKAAYDLAASWVCWAAAAGDSLATHILTDRLANEACPRSGKERTHLLELLIAWSRVNRVVMPFSTNGIRQSINAIDGNVIRVLGKTASSETAKPAASVSARPAGANLHVMAAIGNAEFGEGRELARQYRKLMEPMALHGGNTNLEVLRVVLLRESPWMWNLVEDLFDELNLRRAAGVPWLHFSPILIVGPSGVGKTRFARRLAQLAGTGFREINAAGSSDNRLLMGTARGWHSPQPALPLMVMRNCESANPVIIIDEIDKAHSGGRNGDIRDTLLALLESETARIWFDECFLAECDLSQVSWILTANTTDQIPPPLLSRVRIVRVDGPLPIHFDATLRSIVGEFARELGLRADELPELGETAKDELRTRFAKNASVRELKRLVRRALSKSAALIERVLH